MSKSTTKERNMTTTSPRYDADLDTIVVNVHDMFEIADNRDGTFDVFANVAESRDDEPEFSLDARSVPSIAKAIDLAKASVTLSDADENTIRDAFRRDA